jgi:hypothetical protein
VKTRGKRKKNDIKVNGVRPNGVKFRESFLQELVWGNNRELNAWRFLRSFSNIW